MIRTVPGKQRWFSPTFCFRAFFLTFSLFALSFASFAQDGSVITVKGKVVNQDGSPIADVSVIASSGAGTATDAKGEYTIRVDKDGNLTFTSVNYDPTIEDVEGRTTINVTLNSSEATQLADVVIVGYGQQKKVNLTGAVATIDSKILEDRPISRLSQGLQGAVANLNIMTQYGGGAPNATQSFNIRGYTGFGTTGGPLIVIDGVQGGDINAINPNDVDNISVIKDAAAAAIYGSSAPYGVILVTTKRGKTGKPTITYNNSISVNTPIGMPKMLNSIDFAHVYNEAAVNAGQQEYAYFSKDAIERMEEYQKGILKTETVANPNPGADSWLGWFASNANNDWFKIYYKNTQVVQQHNISVSGGTDKTKYFLGVGYNDRPGMLRYGSDVYKRFNLRANLSNKFTDWLEFNLRTYYSKETYNAPWAGGNRTGGNWMHQIARKHPNIALYTPNPDGGAPLYSELSDVLLMLDGGRHIEAWDKPTLTGEFVISPIRGWNTTINYTYDANIWNNSDHLKTVYQTLPSGKQSPIDWTYPNDFSRSLGFQYHQVLNAFSSYDFSLADHNFTVLAGYVREQNDNLGVSGGNNNLYTDNVPSISTAFGTTPRIGDSRVQLASQGFFGRLNYNFREKYLLEVVGRYDGTSRFLADSRWGFYPGISAGWNVNKEGFWTALGLSDVINALKIRGSYGAQGDQSVFGTNWYPFYPSLGTASPTSGNWYFSGGREARTGAPGLVNTEVTWVTTKVLNFGVDLSAFNNRFSLVFETYKRSADNFLGPARDLPAVLGTGVPQENVAAIKTTGFELTLGWRDRIGEFSYNLRGILSNYRGVVTKFPNDARLITNWYVGEEMGSIYGYTTVGYFTGDVDVAKSADQSKIYSRWSAGDIKYKDLNGDGIIDWGDNTIDNMGDRSIIGNSTPKYQYSLFADMGWKNWDASFFIQGVGKRQFFFGSGTNYFWGMTGSEWQSSPFTVHMDRWTPTNTDGYFPKFYMSGENGKNMQTQTKYLQNAAYLRLKNVQVGYTLPRGLLDKVGIQKLRAFVLVENIFTVSPLKRHSTIDPETFFSDMKIYPMQRSYSGGISLTF